MSTNTENSQANDNSPSNNNYNRTKRPFRRRGRRNKPRNQQNQNVELPVCEVCQSKIRDLRIALQHPESHEPIHFDCALKLIKKDEQMTNDERLSYLGNGSFGIIQRRNPGSPIKFFIRKRIQFEEQGKKGPWRKTISAHIARL